MDIRKGDRLVMKKKHPCGANEMIVLRTGMDFKLRCAGCAREFMIPRSKAERSVKAVSRPDEGTEGPEGTEDTEGTEGGRS